MVHTQLQLKWPNHSTHLLTRLTYLFKNEQLVDCTLMCNKHSLKVHRSVLAACSPYFERELQNNPSLVVKDMQFNVLKALIEFMYYGETRITEENLTSLIEAAKIFEVKGLSEMDIANGKNGIVSSASALSSDNDCIVESSCLSEDVDKSNAILQQSLSHSAAVSSISTPDNNISSSSCSTATTTTTSNHLNHCGIPDDGQSLYEGGELVVESTSSYDDQPEQPQNTLHSSRNFVVTPPQTESAQILLSLARSHSQKLFSSHIDENGTLTNGVEDQINSESGFLNPDSQINGDSLGFDRQEQQPQQQQSNLFIDEHNLIINDTSANNLISVAAPSETSGGPNSGGKSLLAKLLTRNNHEAEQATTTYAKSTLYEVSKDSKTTATPMTAAELQPSIILECPFLIETTDGDYVDVCVDNMLNSFDGSAPAPVTIPMTSETALETEEGALYDVPVSAAINLADPAVLERIKHDTAPELKVDPEAVVLTKISEDGRVEKYVLSSADIQALKQMNERLAAAASTSGRPSPASMATEIVVPGTNDNPLITRILVDGTGGIQNAINRLPFKKTVVGSSVSGSSHVENATDGLHQAILDSSLTVDDAHHHENMFEELDNQFNTMGCCAIDDEEHIRRDYVAYEEASKNETQLEHNYYANALKDEDEEGVVITDGQYDLRMMMMIEETPQSNDPAVPKSSPGKKRYQNVQVLGTTGQGDICLNGNTLVTFGPSKTTPNTIRINGAAASTDKSIIVVPPNGSGAAGKCDLIINDALMSSVLNVVPASTAIKTNAPTTTKRKVSGDNVLPFKTVKSANTFRNSTNGPKKSSAAKRTYNKRKSNASDQNQSKKMSASLNGAFSNENNLIEEIIVDEIS